MLILTYIFIGKNISKLRSEYTATIQVPDCSGPERVISITSDIETAIQIVQQIIPCLEEFPAYSKSELKWNFSYVFILIDIFATENVENGVTIFFKWIVHHQ